ncbi:UNVERIFIED_CONTAM: Pentatricopeptide repeat-containing protein [Sesamum radiatum]|uniref:Pentatricopeptide repeat-containing protein n=1 Tax=Sesamum radiatum TaxID=300843 RepID=A0AAW2NAN5_SESRA
MRFSIIPADTNIRNLYHKIKESSVNGRWEEVFFRYREIKRVGVQPIDHSIFPHTLKACCALPYTLGKSVHVSLLKQGFESFSSVGNSLMHFYAKSGELASALDVFNCMKMKDSVSWNIILQAHLDEGAFQEACDLFMQARAFGFEPNISNLVLIVQAYRRVGAFIDGEGFHGYLIQSGLWSLTSVQNSLLGLYTDISMEYAEKLFHEMYEKDVISWSVMVGGYVHSYEPIFALETFKQMVTDFGLKRMDKPCDVDSAATAFREITHRNIISWNSLLSGFVHNEKHGEALTLFASMRKSGVDADEVTLVNLLQICKVLGDLRQCKLVHSRVFQGGFQSNDLVMNSLIDAYAKCNQINLAWRVFCQMKRPDIVTWSTIISGFTHCGMPDEAIALYRDMRLSLENPNPNPVTLLSLLEACALSAELGRSKWAHGIAIRMGLASDVVVGTAILDMYSKCGAIPVSRKAFDQIFAKNIISWSAIITAYGLNGLPHDALALLYEMEVHGLKPNPVTILSVLSACCHGGLVEEGLSVFKGLANKHGTELKLEHYSCLVDLLARAGNLDDALELIKSIPVGMKPGASAWGALLSACRNYENGKLTAGALSQILELEPSNSAGYLIASNMYATGGSWMDATRMRCLMKERGIKVVAGYSLVHVSNKAYTFTAGDKYHPMSHLFCPVIEQLHSCMGMDMGARLPIT